MRHMNAYLTYEYKKYGQRVIKISDEKCRDRRSGDISYNAVGYMTDIIPTCNITRFLFKIWNHVSHYL